ncbi:MAG TPA: aspartyl protease family protein [Caulobacteraceae bacterium]|jgi:tetratricopeptide (TPR) repeat protein
MGPMQASSTVFIRFGRFFVHSLAWLAAAAAMLAATAVHAECRLEGFAAIPVTMVGMRPLVHAMLNGQDAVFLVDTGAFASALTPAAAARYRVRVYGRGTLSIEGIDGPTYAQTARVEHMELGGAPFYDVPFLVLDGVGRDVAGVLGRDVLGQADAEYDFANGVMRLIRTKGCGGADVLSYWTDRPTVLSALPGFRGGGSLDAQGEVNGQKLKVGFDSGSAYSDMTLKAAARAGVTPSSPDVSQTRATVGITGRAAATWSAPFARVDLGTEAVLHTRLRIAQTDLAGDDMLLGADFFLAHRIYVSRQQRRIYITYNGGPVFRLREAPAVSWSFIGAPPGGGNGGDPNAPVDAAGFARRGAASVSRGDSAAAVDDFTRAITLAPQVAAFWFDRGAAEAVGERTGPALADFDAGLKLQPDHPAALLARASLEFDAGRATAAEDDMASAAKAAGDDPLIDLEIAGLYEGGGLYPQSIAAYGRWIDDHPRDALMAEALAGRCRARALARTELDLAVKDCDAAVRERRTSGLALASRGVAHVRRGEFDLAIADADAALKTGERPFWALEARGLAEHAKGQDGPAATDLAAAAEVDSRQAGRLRKLGLAPALEPVAATAR